MRKKELVLVHQLLTQLHSNFEEELPDGVTTRRYGELDVSPVDFHGSSKKQQKHAVLSLVNDITDSIEEQEGETMVKAHGADD